MILTEELAAQNLWNILQMLSGEISLADLGIAFG